MYINPNSTVKLLKNVPLDNTYEHSVKFDTAAQQQAWFNNYVKTGMVFEKQYYQRYDKGSISLEVLADNVFDCNYMMFQNTAYGNKWFYAFITKLDYRNDHVTEIEYEIDDMQTWLFDYQLKACFVEREHSSTDVAGDNLLPENIDTGDVFAVDRVRFIGSTEITLPEGTEVPNLSIVVAAPWRYVPSGATFADQYVDTWGGKFTGGYGGLYYNIFSGANKEANAATCINNAGVKASEIVVVFYAFTNLIEAVEYGILGPATEPVVQTHYAPKTFGNFGSYTPKNKKIYTHPYTYLRLKDGFGNFRDYKYEYFKPPVNMVDDPAFKLTGDCSPNPSVVCIPKYYMGEDENYSETAIVTGFPQCSFNSDAYIAWLAQSGIRVMSDVVGGGLGGASEGASGIAAGAAGSLQGEISGILSGFLTTQLKSRQVGGTQSSMVSVTADMIFIDAEQMQIREEYARIIDSYWTKFGYPVRKVKVPTYNARPKWNYVKTIGCMAVGSVPADAMRHICSIFDKGITWWNRTATIGDYSQNNNLS